MKKKTGINRFRILALAFSVILFAAGIIITLGIFLPITGLVPPDNALFRMGQQVFSVYRFSAFLIPILFLYGAVLLLIPGWTRESKAVLLGVPLYFVTAIIAERLITIFSPTISLPIVRHFVIISIVICALLLVCFEIFLMLMLAEKLTGRHFVIRRSIDEPINSNIEDDDQDDFESNEREHEPSKKAAAQPETAQASADDEQEGSSEEAANETSPSPAHAEPSAVTDVDAAAAVTAKKKPDSADRQSDEPIVSPHPPADLVAETADAHADTAVETPDVQASADPAEQEYPAKPKLELLKPIDGTDMLPPESELVASGVRNAASSSDTPVEHDNQPEHDMPSEQEPLPLSTPLTAVIGKLPTERATTASPADEAVHGEPDTTLVAGADAPAFASASYRADGAESAAHAAAVSVSDAEITAADETVSATDASDAEILPAMEENPAEASGNAAHPAEPEPVPVFDPADPDNLFSSLEEITEPIERIKRGEYVRPQTDDTAPVPPFEQEPVQDDAFAASFEEPEETHVSDTPAPSMADELPAADTLTDEPEAQEASPAPATLPEEPAALSEPVDTAVNTPAALPNPVDTAVNVSSEAAAQSTAASIEPDSSESPRQPAADMPQSTAPDAANEEATAYNPSEDEEPADENWEPVMPLVFTNGIPIPNETSDLLDTLVVIDSEAQTADSPSYNNAASVPQHDDAAVSAVPAEADVHDVQTPAEQPRPSAAAAETAGYEETAVDAVDTEAAESRAADYEAETADTAFDAADESLADAAECGAANVAEPTADPDDVYEADDDAVDIGAESETDVSFEPALKTQPEIAATASDTPASTAEQPAAASGAPTNVQDEAAFLNAIEQGPAIVPCKPAPPPPPRKKYAIPFDLLTDYPDGEYWIVDDATRRSALMLKSTFNEFKIDVSITGIRKGPVVTMFEMLPSPGIKLSKITNLQDNIALRLAASSVRIVAPIPGKHAVGIEVPNKKRSIVSFRELIEADLPEAAKMAIPIVIGKDVTGNPQLLDLASTPHLLIAGATGSGKSVCVNSIILSILYNRRPDEVKLILVDPKIVELKLYNDIAHLLTPVITEPKRAFQALQYALCEMERRYALLDNMGVRDIKTFNAKIKAERIATEALPYIVIIIDEFADLMATSGKELEATVARLCAMSRAVGIHLVLATQRPSIDVITGLIKANIPSRIAFMVASKTDSRIILDEMGAEKLLGKGDMLYVSAARPFPTRMQGAFVSEQEVERVVACVKEYCEPEYIDDEIFVDDDDESFDTAVFSDENDPLYDQALEIVTFAGKASASYVQRKLKIGYNRAARLIEEMEARGIVGPANGSKPREILRRS